VTSPLDAAPERSDSARALGYVGTVLVHGLMIAGASLLGVGGVQALSAPKVTELVEVSLPVPPPRAAEPVANAPAPARARSKAVARAAELPPAAAAQAGQILDAKAEVVDFGESFPTGSADGHVGGVTDGLGTSKRAVREGSARGAGPPPVSPPPRPDLSRPPRLAGAAQWQCPFPPEADDAGIDHAVVTLRVEVAADGSVQRVSTTTDPGNGFGREARRCASSKRWTPGLDREGQSINASAVVNVRFAR
jgi:protein TonB